MTTKSRRVGLVLSGGGSIGAYHVGLIRYLADKSIPIDTLAGASIGALNGAIIASSSNLLSAANNLEEIWKALATKHPLKSDNADISLSLLNAFAKVLRSPFNIGLYDESSINNILEEYFSWQKLQSGIPFYVSVYPSQTSLVDISNALLGVTSLKNTLPSEFLHLQSLDSKQQINAILASAAIPICFKAKKVNNQYYADGGIGGMKNSQGNTPITPLIKKERCSHIIVNHLSDGSLWDRHDFPEATILEIRSGGDIKRQGLVKDLLDFDANSINSWIEQGYEDTKRCFERVGAAIISGIVKPSDAKRKRDLALKKLNNAHFDV